MKTTVNKFIQQRNLPLTNNEVMLCIDSLQGTKLSYSEDNNILGRVYREKINNTPIKSKHNYWGTNYRDREFKATAKNILSFINKKEGYIQKDFTDGGIVKLEGSEGTVCYSASLKLFGDFRYKYQRGISTDVEIYSFYDYDDNLGELLGRLREYYNNLFSFAPKTN
jgi:hypothetical protein